MAVLEYRVWKEVHLDPCVHSPATCLPVAPCLAYVLLIFLHSSRFVSQFTRWASKPVLCRHCTASYLVLFTPWRRTGEQKALQTSQTLPLVNPRSSGHSESLVSFFGKIIIRHVAAISLPFLKVFGVLCLVCLPWLSSTCLQKKTRVVFTQRLLLKLTVVIAPGHNHWQHELNSLNPRCCASSLVINSQKPYFWWRWQKSQVVVQSIERRQPKNVV